MTEIGDETFRGYTGLESITVPNSVRKIGTDAFVGCPKDMTISGNPRPRILAKIREQIGQE